MSNLLSAGIYRLLRSKVFYVGILAAVVVEVYCLVTGANTYSLDSYEFEAYYYGLEDHFFFYSILLVIEMPAFCGLFFGAEYSSGTLRSKLVTGVARWKLYTANLVLGAVASLVFSATAIVTGLALGFFLMGGFHFQMEAGLLAGYFLCSLAVGVASASFATMLSLLVSNRAVGLVIGVLTAFSLLFVGQYLVQGLAQPEMTQEYEPVLQNGIVVGYAYSADAPMVPNPRYVGGALRTVYTFLLHFMPMGQCFLVSFLELEEPWKLLSGAALFTALTTGIGLAIFQRKDVK